MRIEPIKRQIIDDARRARRGTNGWQDFLARVAAFRDAIPAEGISEPEFCRRMLPVMDYERETLLTYLHRQGYIWRRRDGIERLVLPRRPEELAARKGRPPRSASADHCCREAHRAFSDGMVALVDAIDSSDKAIQQTASESIRIAAERLVHRGATWASMRAATRVYRPDALAVLQRHETAFDPRSGECLIQVPPSVPRSSIGSSLADRILRAVAAAGRIGASRTDIKRATSAHAADLTQALEQLAADGILSNHESRGEGRGARSALRYTLSVEQPSVA